jgi:hypothetical protein
LTASARVVRSAALLACASAVVAGATSEAWAGAWTDPQGQGLLIESFYGWTGSGAPWGGAKGVWQDRFDAEAYVEYGLTDDWTIFGQMAIERYQLGEPTPNLYAGLDYSGIGLRRKLWSTGQWVLSGEATLFLPGAYDPNAPAQEGNTGGAGEGRLSAGANFSLGPWPGFVDGEVAYRVRTAGPPNEWHADATVGLKPAPGWILMLQNFTTVSMPSSNREFPAWRGSIVEASLVVPLDGRWSLQFSLFKSVLAVKTNTERGAAVSVWRRF